MPTTNADDTVRPYVTGSIIEVRDMGPCYFGQATTESEWLADENMFRLRERLGDVV